MITFALLIINFIMQQDFAIKKPFSVSYVDFLTMAESEEYCPKEVSDPKKISFSQLDSQKVYVIESLDKVKSKYSKETDSGEEKETFYYRMIIVDPETLDRIFTTSCVNLSQKLSRIVVNPAEKAWLVVKLPSVSANGGVLSKLIRLDWDELYARYPVMDHQYSGKGWNTDNCQGNSFLMSEHDNQQTKHQRYVNQSVNLTCSNCFI